MSLISMVKGCIKSIAPARGERLSTEVLAQLKEFEASRPEDRATHWEGMFNADELSVRLAAAGLRVEEERIDAADFERWLADFSELVKFYERMGEVKIEKLLEHYLTSTRLGLGQGVVFIDIAASNSPFAGMLRKRGMDAWRQDLAYPQGIKGRDIGGDAAMIPVDDAFADALALHCALECFRADSDKGFAEEALRVLKKGGRLGIVPLYLDTVHFVKTSPYCPKSAIQVEKEARWLWRDDRYKEPYSRHYSPESFVERVASRLRGMDSKVIRFVNLDELEKAYPGQRIYCHFMFKGEKL